MKPEIKEVGAWNNLPHYSIVGDPASFYVWARESEKSGEASAWINGRSDLFYKLRNERKNKASFVATLKEIHKEFKK